MSVVVTTGDLISAANWNALSFGTLGYAEVTSSQTGIGTSDVDLTGLSVAVTVEASRRIKVTGHVRVIKKSNAGLAIGSIREGTTTLGSYGIIDLQVDETSFFDGSAILTPSSGSHTYKLSLRASPTSVDTVADADLSKAFILVEDIGST